MRSYPSVTLTEKGTKFIHSGHVWVYDTEIVSDQSLLQNGDITDVYSCKGRYLGTGFFNSNSKIRVRIVTKNANDLFNDSFWYRKLRWALEYRKAVMGNDFSCCRLIFGEADAFPGLTVDRFGDVLVTEVLSFGIEKRKELIYTLLLKILREEYDVQIRILYERNDSPLREREGLKKEVGYFAGQNLLTSSDGYCHINENGIEYRVDFVNGQKTGFFLDQKYNRLAIQKISYGRRVLDCFTHTGSFALNAAKGGAEHVTAVDISKDALAVAQTNARLNNFDHKIDFCCADVFDYLTKAASSSTFDYDFVILDPPAFTKSRDTVQNASKGYREINRRAMQLLQRGSYLATCSCSHFMTEPLFCKLIQLAASDANVNIRQIECRQQSPDHPILWGVPETSYLKFLIFQIV